MLALLSSICLEWTDLIEMHCQQSESSCLGWIECRRLNFYRREGIFPFFVFPLMIGVGYGKLICSQTLSAFEIKAANVLYIVRLLYLNMLNGQLSSQHIQLSRRPVQLGWVNFKYD